jgi:WD40 repeat protein
VDAVALLGDLRLLSDSDRDVSSLLRAVQISLRILSEHPEQFAVQMRLRLPASHVISSQITNLRRRKEALSLERGRISSSQGPLVLSKELATDLIAASPDGTRLFCKAHINEIVGPYHEELASSNNIVEVSLQTAEIVRHLQPESDNIGILTVSPNGRFLLSGLRNGQICIWDVLTGEKTKTLTGHKVPVTSLCMTPDEEYVISGTEDGWVYQWDFRG